MNRSFANFIAKGETFSCDAGHAYAKAIVNIGFGKVCDPEDFAMAEGQSSGDGEPMLCKCGRRVRSLERLAYAPAVRPGFDEWCAQTDGGLLVPSDRQSAERGEGGAQTLN